MKIRLGVSLGVSMMLFMFYQPVAAEDCAKATQIARQAFDLGENPTTFPEQKRLLAQTLQLCPDHPEAHNNLAWILSRTGKGF